jgi:hypothetical protein
MALLPGLYAWWSGRQLLRLVDDPVLPERLVARSTRLMHVGTYTVVLLVVLGRAWWYWLVAALVWMGIVVGSFPLRKRLHDGSCSDTMQASTRPDG